MVSASLAAALATGGVGGIIIATAGSFVGGFVGSVTAQAIMINEGTISTDTIEWDTASFHGGLNALMSLGLYYGLTQLGPAEGTTCVARFFNSSAPAVLGNSMGSYFESLTIPNIADTKAGLVEHTNNNQTQYNRIYNSFSSRDIIMIY